MTTEQQAAQVEETTATETTVDETVVQAQSTEDSASQTADTTAEPKKENKVQERINKITADKWTEKRRADTLQKEIDDLKANQTKPAQTVTTEPVMPNEADFDYDADKYNVAMARYHADVATQATNKALAANASKTAQDVETVRRQDIQDEFWRKAEKANIEGFDTALATLPTFDTQILEALMSSENAPEVSIFLSNHLDIADTIANSSPVVAAMKIGEISSRLANTTQTNNISNAPDPIETLNQGGAATGERDDQRLDGATFE